MPRAPRLDKARGLERRPMAYQVRLPNIQVRQDFKKPAPPQQYKKVSQPCPLPPAPTNTMSSLIANTAPNYMYARDCLCCPTGITIPTSDSLVLKLVFKPGCEKCEACTCKPMEVAEDEENVWKLFWDLNTNCNYCHATAQDGKHGGVGEHENVLRKNKSFDQKIWEAFVYTDGADGAAGLAGVRGESVLIGAATGSGEGNGVAGQSEGDSFASYFTDAEAVTPKKGKSGDGAPKKGRSDDWGSVDSEYTDIESHEEVVVEPVVIGGQVQLEKHMNQRNGAWLLWKGLYSGYRFGGWGNLLGL